MAADSHHCRENIHATSLQCKRNDEISQYFHSWSDYHHRLSCLNALRISCWTTFGSHSALHGFSDASSAAFAGVVYFRIINIDDLNCHLNYHNSINISLLTAKSKTAPLKTLNVLRLELFVASSSLNSFRVYSAPSFESWVLLMDEFHHCTYLAESITFPIENICRQSCFSSSITAFWSLLASYSDANQSRWLHVSRFGSRYVRKTWFMVVRSSMIVSSVWVSEFVLFRYPSDIPFEQRSESV